MLGGGAVVVGDDGVGPGGAAVAGDGDPDAVGVRPLPVPLQPVRGQPAVGQGQDRREVGPVDEEVVAPGDRPRLGPAQARDGGALAAEDGEAEAVAVTLRHRLQPGEVDGLAGSDRQVRTDAAGGGRGVQGAEVRPGLGALRLAAGRQSREERNGEDGATEPAGPGRGGVASGLRHRRVAPGVDPPDHVPYGQVGRHRIAPGSWACGRRGSCRVASSSCPGQRP